MLKKLPIRYVGELHQVRLINFSVEKEEVLPYLPKDLKVRDYHGRALISLVNVKLRNMRPSFAPKLLHFDYQHIGFRLLVDDAPYSGGAARGIYFLRSFTDKALIVQGGRYLTNYRLEKALITNTENRFELRQGETYLTYTLHEDRPQKVRPALQEMIGALDRAYSHIDGQLVRVRIMRERWPIEWMSCEGFETSYFQTARFEGAFQVRDVIHYQWLPPMPVVPCA